MPSSYLSADFPAYLCNVKVLPLAATPFCGILMSVLSIDMRQSLPTSCPPNLLSKTIWRQH